MRQRTGRYWVERGEGDRLALQSPSERWTYAGLAARVNRIANVLVGGSRPGAGQPGAAARAEQADDGAPAGSPCSRPAASRWRPCRCCAPGNSPISIEKAKIRLALCDRRSGRRTGEGAAAGCPSSSVSVGYPAAPTRRGADGRGACTNWRLRDVDTAADDVGLIAFTSGTTGAAQGHHAFPPRRAGDLRLLCRNTCCSRAPTTSSSASRRSPSPSASAACCCSRCGSAPRPLLLAQATPEELLAGDRDASRHRLLHRADRSTAPCCRSGARSRHLVAAQMRLGRRDAAAADLRGLAGARPASRSSTASARPRCCTSSSRRRATTSAPAPPASRSPATERTIVDDDGNAVPPGTVGRLAVQGPDRLPLSRRCRASSIIRAARLEPHRRRLSHGRGRLFLVPGAHRRHDHLAPATTSPGPRSKRRCSTHPRGARMRAWSARPTRSAARSSRPSSCCGDGADRRTTHGRVSCRIREARDRALQISARRSNSSPRCRAPRPARCSASPAPERGAGAAAGGDADATPGIQSLTQPESAVGTDHNALQSIRAQSTVI